MLERALAAGVPFGWVTGDTVYGGDRRLRVWLESHAIRHVMAVKCTEPLWTMTEHGPGQVAAQDLIARVPAEQWLRINAGDGSKGKRFYDWSGVPLWRPGWPANVGFWLLARRKISDPDELAYYVCFAPPTPRCSPWSGSRAAGGGSRRPSSRPRARSGWTTTKSASTRPGTGTSPWPWSRWRSWPSPAPAFLMPTTGSGCGRDDRAGRAGRALRRRAASAAGLPGLAPTGRPGVHPRLVDLAPPSSSHRSTHPLPATTHKTATVGLTGTGAFRREHILRCAVGPIVGVAIGEPDALIVVLRRGQFPARQPDPGRVEIGDGGPAPRDCGARL